MTHYWEYPWDTNVKNNDPFLELEFLRIENKKLEEEYPGYEEECLGDWGGRFFIRHVDTLDNKVIYTIILDTYGEVTKTGTLEELKYWAKHPYRTFNAVYKEGKSEGVYHTDNPKYDYYMGWVCIGIVGKVK